MVAAVIPLLCKVTCMDESLGMRLGEFGNEAMSCVEQLSVYINQNNTSPLEPMC